MGLRWLELGIPQRLAWRWPGFEYRMKNLDELLDLADRWDETPPALRGSPETFCESHPELKEEFKQFLSQRDQLQLVLQGSVGAVKPESLVGREPSPRFRLKEFLKSGGLGWVYLAEDRELGRNVAVKCLQPAPALDPRSQQRFVREAEITALLEHPGIVPVYGLFQDDSHFFYAMRFVQGETMQDRISRMHATGRVDWRGLEAGRVLRALSDVCDTIAYAHSRGVIHRDLKPLNIMLGPFGETLVLDWGLAKRIDHGNEIEAPVASHADAEGQATQHGETAGTVGYMSPEQARGDWNQVGPWSDQFSLGAMLFQILTDRPPYTGKSGLSQSIYCQFTAPRAFNRSIPKPLEAICLKAMRQRPAERYASVADLKTDIERFLGDLPLDAYREGWLELLQRFVRRHQAAVRIALAMLLCIIGLLTYFLQQARDNNRSLQLANQQAQAAVKRADAATIREQERAEQAESERQRANEEARQANQLVTTLVQMFENSAPQNTSSPMLLADWLEIQLQSQDQWEVLRPDRAGAIRYYFAVALARNSRQQEAVPYLRLAIQQLEEGDNPTLLCRAMTELGLLLLSRTAGWQANAERDSEGLQWLREALAIAEQNGAGQSTQLLTLAKGYQLTGDLEKALELGQQVLNDAQRTGSERDLWSEACLFVASLWNQVGRAPESVRMLRELLSEKQPLAPLMKAETQYQLADALSRTGLSHFPEALKLLDDTYQLVRQQFGNTRHPSVVRVGYLYATLAFRGAPTPHQRLIELFAKDFDTLELDSLTMDREATIAAAVALARCQRGEAADHWLRCQQALDKSLTLQAKNPDVYYLRILLAKSMASQKLAAEALPIIESVDQALTTGALLNQKNARFLQIPTLHVLYGTNYLLGNDAELERIKQRFPPGVALPQMGPR